MISRDLRLLSICRDHVTGTGEWDYVVVLGCIDGHLKAIFHDRFKFGADIKEATADKLVLIAGYWRRRDAHCCPSGEQRMVYTWNKELRNYVLSEVAFQPRSP